MNKLKPSMFLAFPWESQLGKTEAETVARNTMVIRSRLGDKWDLSWKEYKAERKKDGDYPESEKEYFDQVMKLIPDAIGAIGFSQTWAKTARKALKEQNEQEAKTAEAVAKGVVDADNFIEKMFAGYPRAAHGQVMF